ncbi:hypothetical protein BU25DRAFT_458659 [Macroventuria anomochaeta]|uniref:Uncharacterized protein n=1 Tax=Macroventuria anomochaeta TaxID=301207 RepID=A0ACB6S0W9_9PLEO|nr:uncharacterized protein BU25DRAFT_458659 [Macroventuria anomochaeta]KAF2627310.1 hypothetical protein BU25DRAFT_458659 [Macroventuria anomochaeta]
MVTTRRQSKSTEPPALPPVAPPKRKRSNDAAPSAAQPPIQPSSKRRKKVKSTAKVKTDPVPTESAPATRAAKRAAKRPGRPPKSMREAERQACKQVQVQEEDDTEPKTNGNGVIGSRQPPQVDLTDDIDSSEDEAARRPQPAASQDTEDEDADSRYALGPRRKGKTKKPAAPTARRTAELKFEEDGLEEVDKAEAVVADVGNRAPTQDQRCGPPPGTPVNQVNPGKSDKDQGHQVIGKERDKAHPKKIAPPAGVSFRFVMFTVTEAIAALSLYKEGTISVPAQVDPQSHQPYEPLQIGEYLSYPVKGTYHLGALGRYGIDTTPPPPFSLTVPLSEDSSIQTAQDTSAKPSRHGVGFDTALPTRLKPSSKARRNNNYCFTSGRYHGRRMDSVPMEYLRTLFNGLEYQNGPKLQQAFADLYPKGLDESKEERYRIQDGKLWGKRLDEAPPSYCWGLLRKKQENDGAGLVGVIRRGRGKLERALEV